MTETEDGLVRDRKQPITRLDVVGVHRCSTNSRMPRPVDSDVLVVKDIDPLLDLEAAVPGNVEVPGSRAVRFVNDSLDVRRRLHIQRDNS